jgi:alpha-beta hydrolase superfamily lysophospholipase
MFGKRCVHSWPRFRQEGVKLSALGLLLLITSCTYLFYQPTRYQYVDPQKFNLKKEDVWFTSKDGTKLHGWFFKSKKHPVKGTIIQFHGNAQNLSSHFLSLLWLIDEGYNLFTFDYRGYGQSEGHATIDGVYEDSLAALAEGLKLQKENGGGHYVVYGQSLGGAISLRALPDFKDKDKVTFLVQDSTFSSYKAIAFDRVSSVWFMIPVSPLAYVLISNKYASYKVFDKVTWPTLVISGEKDQVMPVKFGKEIYQKISSKKKWFWEVPEARHIEVFFVAKGKYRKDFLSLLDQNSSH